MGGGRVSPWIKECLTLSDVKQDRRQVCLSDEGREALLDALRKYFPRYPLAVYPDRWLEVTRVDRRTVEKMLGAGQRVRQASIASIFKDLGAEFNEIAYLEQYVAADSESAQLNGVEETSNGLSAPPTSMPARAASGRRPIGYAPAMFAVLLVVALAGFVYVHFHSPPHSALNSQQTVGVAIDQGATDQAAGGMVLYDQFKADETLKPDLWTVNGPASRAALSNFENPPYPIITPKIALDRENGLSISSTGGNSQQGAIQSVRSFNPPFTVTALCNATSILGDPLRLAISDTNGTKGVSLGFGSLEGSGEDADAGSFFCTAPNRAGAGARTPWEQVGAPLSPLPPARDIWYVLTIVVDASGKATAAVSSGGFPIGTATTEVGRGPFYVMLAQENGASGTPGSNQAYCGTIQVISEAEE